jgi:hypothetical protein
MSPQSGELKQKDNQERGFENISKGKHQRIYFNNVIRY